MKIDQFVPAAVAFNIVADAVLIQPLSDRICGARKSLMIDVLQLHCDDGLDRAV